MSCMYQKGNGVSRDFWPKILGLFGGRFEGDWMVFGVEVRRVRVHRLGGARRGFLRLILANRYLPPPISHLFSRLKVSLPGVVGVPIKVIVAHGELGFNDFGLKSCILRGA